MSPQPAGVLAQIDCADGIRRLWTHLRLRFLGGAAEISARRFIGEKRYRQRRQSERQRKITPVRGHRRGFDAAHMAQAAAAVFTGVAVEELAPEAAARHA